MTDDTLTITTTVRNMALVKLSKLVDRLTQPDATDEDFLAATDAGAALTEVVKEYKARLKDAQIEYLGEAGNVPTATGRYYVATARKTKCRNVPLAVDAVLQACGGDFDQLLRCLSNQPLKHGYCSKVLGSEWGRHFEVTEVQDVKEGKPAQVIAKSLPE